jgi:opacity protein-like surface antigen
MKRNKLLIALFVLIISTIILAQNDSTKTAKDKDWEWHWDDWEDWTVDFGFNKTHPAISLQYGLADMSRPDIQSPFVDPNLFELKLGYVKEKDAWGTDYIINHSYKLIYLSNESNKLAGKEAVDNEIKSDMWRFGCGGLSGYGYKLGESAAIIPFYSYTLNWSHINFNYSNALPDSDKQILNLYNDSFRFGTSSEGGVRVKVIDNLMIDAGYERSIVFQRHLFWKWAGSALIEVAAQGLLDSFIGEIFESSPSAGPIVNFLLKNALAYGIYELRQDQMNWPFPSEAPIAYDQFKFGVTVMF